jgi:hypothetical protein
MSFGVGRVDCQSLAGSHGRGAHDELSSVFCSAEFPEGAPGASQPPVAVFETQLCEKSPVAVGAASLAFSHVGRSRLGGSSVWQ